LLLIITMITVAIKMNVFVFVLVVVGVFCCNRYVITLKIQI